jgi:two-component system phosphate regulon sensor histidine kinase PhoR
MIGRVLGLLFLVLLGAAWGWSRSSVPWSVAGALLGALAWGIHDSIRAGRLLQWLNQGDVTSTPNLKGVWGELLDRNRKIFKKLEKKAQSSDARLDDFLSAIQASPNGVVLLDAQGAIEWSNLTAAGHLGFDAQRDLGQSVRNMVRAPAFVAYLAGGDFSHEIQIDGPGPRPSQPNRISLQIHPYGKKRKLMISRDVTALQLAETMRRDFVANVSHEIRTPLTVLSGFVETMQSIPLEEGDRTRYLGLMSQQALRMQTLVNDLLTLSRLEGSPAPGAGEWIDRRGPWRDGEIPVNVSGGLISKGHPIGATGVANIYEVATHLRGEAGDRQIEGARVGMTHVIGLGSACAVHILERAAT